MELFEAAILAVSGVRIDDRRSCSRAIASSRRHDEAAGAAIAQPARSRFRTPDSRCRNGAWTLGALRSGGTGTLYSFPHVIKYNRALRVTPVTATPDLMNGIMRTAGAVSLRSRIPIRSHLCPAGSGQVTAALLLAMGRALSSLMSADKRSKLPILSRHPSLHHFSARLIEVRRRVKRLAVICCRFGPVRDFAQALGAAGHAFKVRLIGMVHEGASSCGSRPSLSARQAAQSMTMQTEFHQ